jgi:GNAT superfamily N-acetyltransferase
MTCAIRPMTAADRQFVRSGWSASYRGARDLPLIPMRGYADIMHPIIDGYLDHPAVRTLVAEGQLGVLFGFVAADPTPYVTRLRDQRLELAGYVYYLYVADPFRRRGFAKQLLAAAGVDRANPFGFAASTPWCRKLRNKIPFAEYDTMRARYLSMEKS